MNIAINKFYSLKSNSFSCEYLDELRKEIWSSSYLGLNQLSDNFAQTKGFSVIFKRSSIEEVERHFSFFKPYLNVALKPSCNAFYLNPLLINEGGSVRAHIDCSISSYTSIMTIPSIVSVLYVEVPPNLQGGELALQYREKQVGQIQPQTNTLLYFRGDLTHFVIVSAWSVNNIN